MRCLRPATHVLTQSSQSSQRFISKCERVLSALRVLCVLRVKSCVAAKTLGGAAECRMLKTIVAFIVAIATLPAAAAAESTHLLIVVGLAGDPEHGELFQKWGTTLAETATAKLGVSKENVTLLSAERATREEVTKAFGALATAAGEDDTVMIVLFGHGTFANKVAKFNLKGPDMTPDDFSALLKRLQSKRVVFVDTASGSGPFVDALSAPGRVIVTATRTGAEQFATLFGGPFVEAFSTEAADADRNGRVTVLEAFEYARQQVAASYKREGLMQTEHALLDDNGDREGLSLIHI